MQYSRTPFIQINWDGKPCRYAENPNYWIFLCKIGYTGSLKWKKISTNSCFRLHIYLHTNKMLIHNSLCVFDNWGNFQAIKRCSPITVRKCVQEGPPFQIISDLDIQNPDTWSSTIRLNEFIFITHKTKVIFSPSRNNSVIMSLHDQWAYRF